MLEKNKQEISNVNDSLVQQANGDINNYGFYKQLSQDLSAEFPEMKGFSLRNIERISKWYITYKDVFSNATQPVPQLESSSKPAQVVWQFFPPLPSHYPKNQFRDFGTLGLLGLF